MNSIEYIQKFLSGENIQKYDLIVESKPSVTGFTMIYRASIDKVDGSNLATSGYEFQLQDAFDNLVEELRKIK